MTALLPGVDTDAFLAGFALALVVTCVVWGALVGVAVIRRMLED